MNVYPLDISWAATTSERRYLHWELLACEQVHAVFPTARDDVFAVLFHGNRRSFDAWARTVASDDALEAVWQERCLDLARTPTTRHPHHTTTEKGAS